MAVIPLAEAVARLESVNWTAPIVDKPQIEQHFRKFLENLSNRSWDYKVRDSVEFYWFHGVDDYSSRLADEGIFASHSAEYRAAHWRYITELNRPDPPTQAELLSQAMGFGNRFVSPRENPWIELLTSISQVLGYRTSLLRDSDLLQAIIAGLGGSIVQRRMVILFPRPAMRTRLERNVPRERVNSPLEDRTVLHSMLGPAVIFPDDPQSNQYWIRGVKVKQFVVEHPDRITRAHIRAARTQQLRRTLIDQYGLLKYCIERGYKPTNHSEQHGATLYVKGGIRGSFRECVVELVNSTPEPDGTRRHFARRVPGNIRTAHEAVAWTFGLRPEEYNPAVQT